MTTVAVCIPSIPPRRDLLVRAVTSACAQSRPFDELHIAVDHHHEGATATRNRAWRGAGTDWVALLDDDDELEAWHLEVCLGHAELTGADLVYPWYTVVGGSDPHPQNFGPDWDPHRPVQTTITILVRRALLEHLGGYREPGDQEDELGHRAGEDFDLVCRANAHGAKIAHLPQRTWRWHHHGLGAPGKPGNTSGLPSRW